MDETVPEITISWAGCDLNRGNSNPTRASISTPKFCVSRPSGTIRMTALDPNWTNRQAALEFLQLVIAGGIEKACPKHVHLGGRHPDPFCPAGFQALKLGMLENHAQFPHKHLEIIRAVGEGEPAADSPDQDGMFWEIPLPSHASR